MRFILMSLAFVASVVAQGISIASPSDGATLTAGDPVNVELDFPNSLTGVQHLSVVISHVACATTPCSTDASQLLGNVLFSGNYTPSQSGNPAKLPNQNFTVTIPADTTKGEGLLNVAHFYLLGAGAQPILEFKNISFNLEAPIQQKRSCISRFCM